RSPLPENLRQARELIKRLGSDEFVEREEASTQLRELGALALPLLRESAKARDAEVARRSRNLLAEAERVSRAVTEKRLPVALAALRLVVRRKAEGAVPVLLRYLPFARGTEEEEVWYGLDELARDAKGKALLQAALKDEHPARRAV